MRKVTLIVSAILLVIGFFACKQSRPEPVVERFYTHFYRSEFEEIQRYVMSEHQPYYEVLHQFALEDTTRKPHVKISDIKCEITGDTIAICSCLIQEGNQEPESQIIQLKMVNKEWLVNKGKEDYNPDKFKGDPFMQEESSEEIPSNGEENTIDK